jgi:hypothetical protein
MGCLVGTRKKRQTSVKRGGFYLFFSFFATTLVKNPCPFGAHKGEKRGMNDKEL